MYMISVEKGLKLIRQNCGSLSEYSVDILESLGTVSSADIVSEITFPPFDQSAMDGYGVKGLTNGEYFITGEIKAGDDASAISLKDGEAVRIFTGAMVPKDVDAVVKQEEVEVMGNRIRIEKEIRTLENIRKKGEQIKKGEVVLKKGQFINPGTIGFMSMLGITRLRVIRKPRIAIVTTGNELLGPTEELTPGKIYDSNTNTLIAALHSYGFSAESYTVKDDYNQTRETIEIALENCDILLITGGISVGDYDYVGDVMRELNVREVFYKLKQKPGKPLYFGMHGEKPIFGLPGNPASVLTCFYVYVTEALSAMVGRAFPFLETRTAILDGNYQKTPKMTHFLKGHLSEGNVEILKAQSSAMLSDFKEANCFIVMPEGEELWNTGDKVEVLYFANSFC